MKNPSWAKVLAFIELAIFGGALAYYATAIVTAGIAVALLGMDRNGDTVANGSALLFTGMAAASVFAFFAVVQARMLLRRVLADDRGRK